MKHTGWQVVAVPGLVPDEVFFEHLANRHRVELACPDPQEEAQLKRLDAVKWEMLEEWSRTKRAPKHAAFLHEKARQTR